MAFLSGSHHCAVFPGSDHGAAHRDFKRCQNPGHEKFLTVSEFKQKDLSEICLNKGSEPQVWKYIDRTVRVVVSYTSSSRPDTYIHSKSPYPCTDRRGSSLWIRYGTGFLIRYRLHHEIDGPVTCPCPARQTSKCQPIKSHYFEIQTAAHVVFDNQEAQHAVFEFFYDSEERSGVECLYGVAVIDDERYRLETDRCRVLCVTHDSRLARRLCEMCDFKISRKGLLQSKRGLMASHPHGVSKRISIGQYSRGKIVVVSKRPSLKLNKGVQVRFSGCDNVKDLMTSINRHLNCHAIGHVNDGQRDVFRLICDVTVTHTSGIIVECDSETTCFPPMTWKSRWWCLPPGIVMTTDGAGSYTLPQCPEDIRRSVMMEYCLKGSEFKTPLLLDDSIEKLFVYYKYDVASCPGSSGGSVVVKYLTRLPFPWFYHFTHFGNMGDLNRSGLMEDTALNCGGENRSEWFNDDFDDNDDDDDF